MSSQAQHQAHSTATKAKTHPTASEAMELAAHGWRVHPLRQQEKRPLLNAWHIAATTDEDVIGGWWEKYPNANVGVAMGPDSGIISLDCDSPEAEKFLLDLFDGNEIVTPHFQTSRGTQYIFKYTSELPNSDKANWKLDGLELDFKIGNGKGSYCVFPPSIHPDGSVYRWLLSPDDCDVLDLPDQVIARLCAYAAEGSIDSRITSRVRTKDHWSRVRSGVSEGERNETAASLCGKYISEMTNTASPTEQGEVYRDLQGWNKSNTPPLPEYELRRTFESILRCHHEDSSDLQAFNDGQNGEAIDDPHKLARLSFEKIPSLKYYRGDFFKFDGSKYREMEMTEVNQLIVRISKAEIDRIYDILPDRKKRKKTKVTTSLISNVRAIIEAESLLRTSVEAPCWLDGSSQPAPRYCIIARNGIVSLDDPSTLIPPTPKLFSLNCLSFNYDPDASCPLWLSFLDDLWGDDPESIQVLQEMMGYLLLPDTSLQKMFFFHGPPRSGKGTILHIFRKLIGVENVVGPSLTQLTGSFGLQALLNKTVALIGESRYFKDWRRQGLAEVLLSITGEDVLTIDRKHKTSVSCRLPTRFVISSNELPEIEDTSATLPTRMIVLKFCKSFLGKEDPELRTKLENELPGILNWAIEGYQRLNERRRFIQPASGKSLMSDIENLSSPILEFSKECCVVDKNYREPCDDLYSKFLRWSKVQGVPEMQKSIFGKNLRTAIPSVDRKQERGVDPKTGKKLKIYYYHGIRLKTPKELEEE